MKSILIYFIVLLCLIAPLNVWAEEDLNSIYDYVREEIQNGGKISRLGWWQIENNLKTKYDIIIPTKILENVQKYYARNLIDKYSKNYSSFNNMIKMIKFPKNILKYSRDYFNRIKKTEALRDMPDKPSLINGIQEKNSGYVYVKPLQNGDNREAANSASALPNPSESFNAAAAETALIEPLNLSEYDTFLKNALLNGQNTESEEFEKKLEKFSVSLKQMKERSENSEKDFTVRQINPRLFENPSLDKANKVFREIKQSLDKNEYMNLEDRSSNTMEKTQTAVTSDKLEHNDINILKKDLELAMERIKMLNDGIKNFLAQVDSRYDAKLQEALKENQRLSVQLDNANKLASTLKEHLLKKLDESYKNNSLLNKKNLSLADNMIELSDILKEYQNQNLELTELLRKSVNEIERLRNENKQLLIKLNVEFEDLKKENKILKERLDIQTQSISSPKTGYDLEFKSKAAQAASTLK
ncbi:MAG TPA: hypothetical protein PKY81_16705 [bacterium]|nr:hypothetical protein [bacterium]